MKNFVNPRNIFSLSLLITGVAFLAGAFYVFAGIPGTQFLKGPGKYIVELSPGQYESFVYYRWDSIGLHNKYDGHHSFKIIDSAKKVIVNYDNERDHGSFFWSHEFLGREGNTVDYFTIEKQGAYEVSTSNSANKRFILALVPTQKHWSPIWELLLYLELSKDHFCNRRIQ
ncbi:MAG: hypothetical protein KC652_07810 [Cyanobacteria bacterium HKST-UBA01]|nr:hypothetical protein [Cyanobacteria bacterium HKST-UBA01]